MVQIGINKNHTFFEFMFNITQNDHQVSHLVQSLHILINLLVKYTLLGFSDLLTPVRVTSFDIFPGTVFSYIGLGIILPEQTMKKMN